MRVESELDAMTYVKNMMDRVQVALILWRLRRRRTRT